MEKEGYGKIVWYEQDREKVITGYYKIGDDFVEVTPDRGTKKLLGNKFIIKIVPLPIPNGR